MTVGRDRTHNRQCAFREKPRPLHRRARARESWGDGGDRIRAFAPNPHPTPPPRFPGVASEGDGGRRAFPESSHRLERRRRLDE